MTESVQNFRAAFHGFNREDVVRFLEATAARHAAEVNQLRDDVKRLEEELGGLTVVLTGGNSTLVRPLLGIPTAWEPHLTFLGLGEIWKRNTKKVRV